MFEPAAKHCTHIVSMCIRARAHLGAEPQLAGQVVVEYVVGELDAVVARRTVIFVRKHFVQHILCKHRRACVRAHTHQ